MTWKWLVPLAALIALAGYLGLRLGQPLDETAIIERAAAIYLAEAGVGAQRTDCAAAPHLQARMIVVCHHPNGRRFSYVMSARGAVIPQKGQTA